MGSIDINSDRQRTKALFYINSCSCRNDPHPTYQTRIPEPEDNKYRYFLDLSGRRKTCDKARFRQSNYPKRSPWDRNQANVSLELLIVSQIVKYIFIKNQEILMLLSVCLFHLFQGKSAIKTCVFNALFFGISVRPGAYNQGIF